MYESVRIKSVEGFANTTVEYIQAKWGQNAQIFRVKTRKRDGKKTEFDTGELSETGKMVWLE